MGGASSSESSARIVGASAIADAVLGCHQWVARVPTGANVTDGPSRLEFGAVVGLGAIQVHVPPWRHARLAWSAARSTVKREAGRCAAPPIIGSHSSPVTIILLGPSRYEDLIRLRLV